MGLKSLHDLYPSKINEKITADAKTKTWDEKHKLAVAEQSRRLTEFDLANASSKFLDISRANYPMIMNFIPLDTNLSAADKLMKEDLDNGLECLQTYDKQYADLKTIYDCILYQSRDGWRCAIDVAEV